MTKIIKHIYFDKHDAEMIYELALEHFCDGEGCMQCERIRKRLENFIGKEAVKEKKIVVKKHPYCEK